MGFGSSKKDPRAQTKSSKLGGSGSSKSSSSRGHGATQARSAPRQESHYENDAYLEGYEAGMQEAHQAHQELGQYESPPSQVAAPRTSHSQSAHSQGSRPPTGQRKSSGQKSSGQKKLGRR